MSKLNATPAFLIGTKIKPGAISRVRHLIHTEVPQFHADLVEAAPLSTSLPRNRLVKTQFGLTFVGETAALAHIIFHQPGFDMRTSQPPVQADVLESSRLQRACLCALAMAVEA